MGSHSGARPIICRQRRIFSIAKKEGRYEEPRRFVGWWWVSAEIRTYPGMRLELELDIIHGDRVQRPKRGHFSCGLSDEFQSSIRHRNNYNRSYEEIEKKIMFVE